MQGINWPRLLIGLLFLILLVALAKNLLQGVNRPKRTVPTSQGR
ncbi:hypothetical protein [Hymenobacter translucens]|nr:hypothetical protein [Hymenobacter translucens]